MKAYRQTGFTLLELMIALTLGLIIIAAATQLILGSFITSKIQDANAQLQDSGLFGLEYVERDLRLANLGNSQLDMTTTSSKGGIVFTAANIATLDGANVADILSNSKKSSNMSAILSDQLTIQFIAPSDMFNCEGVSVRRGDLIVQRYFLQKDSRSAELGLFCDANTPTPSKITESNPSNAEEQTEVSNPPDGNPTVIKGMNRGAQMIIPRVDQFKVLIGAKANNGQLAYYTIDRFNTVKNLQAISLKLSLLVRSDSALPTSRDIDPSQSIDLFAIETSGLSGKLSDTSVKNKFPRQLYITTIALRNGLGE